MVETMIVYGDSRSGNCYKIALLAHHLGVTLDWREVDVLSGATKTDWFRAINPLGKLPAVELGDGTRLAESNAVLCYLADNTAWWPANPVSRAKVLQWMFWEQYSHEPYIATVRFWVTLSGQAAAFEHQIAERRPQGERALTCMDRHLANRDWFVGDQPSIADIALYAYTHVAHEGGFDMSVFPAIGIWLDRLSGLPSHRPMQAPSRPWQPPAS